MTHDSEFFDLTPEDWIIKGEKYRKVLLRVTETDPESGRIYSADIVRDDDVVELSRNIEENVFYTAWLPVRMLDK